MSAYEYDDRDDYVPDECRGCTSEDCECGGYFKSDDEYDDGDDVPFADPGGRSALRAASRSNPRNLPCPTCKAPNVLTPADVARGYQCDRCADRAEGRGWDY